MDKRLKNKEEQGKVLKFGGCSALSAGSRREATLLREWEEQKTKIERIFFFSLQMALFLSVPPSQ